MYDGFEFGVTVAVQWPSDLKEKSSYLKSNSLVRAPRMLCPTRQQ